MTGLNAENGSRSPQAEPAVSLVLPVYNGERYLPHALDAALAQTFGDFELIAVDDCSSDATPDILAEYAARDSRIRVIRNAQNRKLPASLNIGFAAARAPWLSWTSDDNIMLPAMLEQLIAARDAAPAADILHADYRIIDPKGAKRHRVRTGPVCNLLIDNVVGCCFLYRKEVDAALGGYDEALFGVEDYDFWLRALAAGFAFEHVPHELYHYRRHQGSLTDTRARDIQTMVHERLLPDIAALPPSPYRARAYVRLATRDPYAFRLTHLTRALRDSPVMLLAEARQIITWLRLSLTLRMRRLLR